MMKIRKKSTIALALALTLLLAGCATALGVAKSTNRDISQTFPSDSAINESIDNNENDYYGKWVMQRVLAYGPVGTYSIEDAEKLIGQSLVLSAEEADVMTDSPSNPIVHISHPEYRESVISDSEFQKDFRMSFSELGIRDEAVTAVEVIGSDETRGIFLIKDSDTIVFVAGGTYFELTRQEMHESEI